MLKNLLERNENIDSHIYDGSLSINEREILLDKYVQKTKLIVKDGKPTIVKSVVPKVLIIQIKSGGVGLNLQQFNNVIILSPDWNPSNEIQAIARAHRIGQKKQVIVHKISLFANKEFFKNKADYFDTIDEYILNKQKEKRNLMAELLKDPLLQYREMQMEYNKISEEELVEMFKD